MLKNSEIRIETTNKCNTHCITCPREKLTRKQLIMPYSHFENLVFQSKELGAETIALFGFGEALTDPEIVTKIALCNMLDLRTYIATNASLLTEELSRKIIKSGLKHIRFSVNGVGKNYEKFHRGLKWEEVSHNIGEFMKINDVNGHPCEVTVTCIPMHGETVEDLINKWEPGPHSVKMRVDHLEIWKPHGWAGGRSYRDKTKKRLNTCGRPFGGPIQIQADGTMIVCCFDYNGQMVIGDTHENTIEEILNGAPMGRIRLAHECGDLKGLICEVCDQLNILDEPPLLYSSRNPEREINRTSVTNHKLEVK